MRAHIIDVLYADDCVIFANTIRAMQIMMVAFDEVATLFGMEVAMTKTKVVCDNYSKAMEFKAQEAERQVLVTPQYSTRGSQELARLQVNDVTLFVPVILIRGEKLEVVPYFRYLGMLDKDDGALGVEIQARICRMKQRFKEFEGRVFCNTEVSTLPRMQVFKCMVLTNGMYAAEVWNYTRADMDQLEKHYFRLLRSTLFMSKSSTLTVLWVQFPMQYYQLQCCVLEMQYLPEKLQLLPLYITLYWIYPNHALRPRRIQDHQICRAVGRQRTYKQCIKDALANFGVTMVQCMAMAEQDWDAVIEGTGMETAARQWEARQKASKPIDVEWRTRPEHGPGRRKTHTLPGATAGEDEADIDAEEDSDESCASESEPTDEVEQSPKRKEGNDAVAVREDGAPWDEDARTGAMDVRADEYRQGTRSHGNHVRGTVHNQDRNVVAQDPDNATAPRGDSYQIVEEPMDTAEEILDRQRSEDLRGKRGAEDEMQDSGVVKRKAKLEARHRARNNKRAREELNAATIGRYGIQHRLQLIVDDSTSTPRNASAVPWEHRGLPGQTGGRSSAGDNSDT